MLIKIFLIITFAILSGFKYTALADEGASKGTLVPIPVIYYTPETGVAGGATLIYSYRPQGQSEKVPRSSIFPALVFTQNSQTILVARSRHSYGEDDWRHSIAGVFQIFPNKFYGLGDATRTDDEEKYDSKRQSFAVDFGKRIIDHTFLGLSFRAKSSEIEEREDGGLLDQLKPLGYDGYTTRGLGAYLEFDSTNDSFNPTRGVKVLASRIEFKESFGGSSDYNQSQYYAKHYLPITERTTIAFALNAIEKLGEVPFDELAQLGGQRLLRGIFQGRFRDHALASAQVEWRQFVSDWLGYAIFASAGHVAGSFKKLEIQSAKATAGGGLRFLINKEANVNLRIDIGVAKDSTGFYFGVGQAF